MIEPADTYNIMDDKFRNGNVHVEISCFVTSNWKLLSLKKHHHMNYEAISQLFLQKLSDN